ncbi:unnamed protein product [Adineta steineri]|uniref:Palmitoyltransferase n=1 Tax=Adineta steineri TaxID=433720 RepID=A0A819AL50_9BILA|nr:unnamed protein product [Adineta steineri]CAF3789473.1 unnamed protein product [Adineta steineri]
MTCIFEFIQWKKVLVRTCHLLLVFGVVASLVFQPSQLRTALYDTSNYLYCITYGLFVYLSLFFYFMTCYTDPGFVPYKRVPNWSGGMVPISDDEDDNDDDDDGDEQKAVTTSKTHLRKCLLCNIEQPLRSHHCDFCNRCVLKYDHHCPYLETCIGERNHRYFWCFLLATEILIIWSIVICSQSFVPFSDWSSWLHINKFRLFAMHVLVVSLCATTALFCIHSFFALTNSTTWERVSRHRITYLNRLPDEDLNPFHQGYCHNFFYSFLCHRIKEQQWDIVYKKRVEEHVTLYITAAKGYAVDSASSPFKLLNFERRVPRNDDVVIRIHYCGICHTDIHDARNDWQRSTYPMIPGHEITGIVEQIGSDVKHIRVGDSVGVGYMCDSCLKCDLCKKDFEQHCSDMCITYNSTELDKVTPTYGGYSNLITTREHFVCKIPKNLPLDAAAPLLCAGITVYSPLRRFNVGKGSRIGIVGLGGLGHIAIKFGAAMGAHVTVISTSESKREDAMKLGAKKFLVSKDKEQMKAAKDSLDFIIDTVAANHDVRDLIDLLVFEGVYCSVGGPTKPLEIEPMSLISKKVKITGGAVGGMKETQEMLDFCGKYGITCDIEKINANPETIKTAFDRIVKADVKYRFVLDMLNSF